MSAEKAAEMLTNGLKGFHGKFKKMIGQAFVRVDKKTYLSTGANQIMAEITPDSYELCDMKSGEIGAIFRSRSDINVIIVGCSSDTVEVSKNGRDVPVALEDLARLTGSFLRIVPDSSSSSILSGLKTSSVCLIQGIGAIATGSNCRKAVAGIHIVEKACEAEVHGKLLGGTVPIPASMANKYRENFLKDYTRRNENEALGYYGFGDDEFTQRNTLIEFGKDLVKRDLSYGSWGNLSLRLNKEEMLITPSSMDYFDINPEDIVKVNYNNLKYDSMRVPSSEYRMHAAAYHYIPDCEAIINTRSNGLSVFAACEAGFALGSGELKDLIGDVKVTSYAPPGTLELAKKVVKTLTSTHACIIPHHGGVFYGPSLDVVMAIAEAVEIKARNLLNFDAIPDDE